VELETLVHVVSHDLVQHLMLVLHQLINKFDELCVLGLQESEGQLRLVLELSNDFFTFGGCSRSTDDSTLFLVHDMLLVKLSKGLVSVLLPVLAYGVLS
jgi:hypothetical protein